MSEKPSPALTRKMLMLVTACATVVALALIALPLVVGEPGKKWPDIVLFLGRFHMLVLHIPIGVFVLILLQELAAMVMRRADARPSRFALALGMISAVVAALAGFLLYHGSGDDYAGNELGSGGDRDMARELVGRCDGDKSSVVPADAFRNFWHHDFCGS
jgi:uncharacterized PurR-regulated membrane protein YhhQ (DUF165 family)